MYFISYSYPLLENSHINMEYTNIQLFYIPDSYADISADTCNIMVKFKLAPLLQLFKFLNNLILIFESADVVTLKSIDTILYLIFNITN